MFGAAGGAPGTGSASKLPGQTGFGSGSNNGDSGLPPTIPTAFGNNRAGTIGDVSQSVDLGGKLGQYFTAGKGGSGPAYGSVAGGGLSDANSSSFSMGAGSGSGVQRYTPGSSMPQIQKALAKEDDCDTNIGEQEE